MTYTLWSRGELLGESALDYVRVYTHLRTGDLQVTPKGLTALDRLSQTHADGYHAMCRVNRETARGTFDPADEETLLADMAAEQDQYEALALELRAPNGAVIPTDEIYIRDTEFLLAIDSEREEAGLYAAEPGPDDVLDAEDLAAVEGMLAEFAEDHPPWEQSGPEREPMRFQLYVRLKDQWSVP